MSVMQQHMSRNILIQLAVITLVTILLAVYFSDTLTMIYFSNQQTAAGYAINGLIVALFFTGMLRIVMLLFHYQREEAALTIFQQNLDQDKPDLLHGIELDSIISLRYDTMESMRLQHAPVHHQSLAATLLAHESTRTGVIRFIHNILILCGVLGTIISLSIALFGASSLLEEAVSSTGMGMVIHGMSTALSTTMSAIICYLLLAYFFTAIQGLQTHILALVEQITATRLMPRFNVTSESVNLHAVELVSQAHLLVQSLHDNFEALNPEGLKQSIEKAAEDFRLQHQELLVQLREISTALQDGFRLPKE